MQVAVAKFRGELPSAKDIERLQASSPGLFSSGYFVLAAVAGSKPGDRNQAASVVNLKGGGTAGQIMVVPVKSATTPATQALGSDLVAMSDDFAKASKTEVAVGGNGGAFGDFTSEGKAAIWPIVIAESVVDPADADRDAADGRPARRRRGVRPADRRRDVRDPDRSSTRVPTRS